MSAIGGSPSNLRVSLPPSAVAGRARNGRSPAGRGLPRAVLAVLMALMAADHGPAASSCGHGVGTIKARLDTFSAVFVGRVTGIEAVGGAKSSADKPTPCGTLVSFDVTLGWKGVSKPSITLPNHTIYGGAFEIGKEYLVVAMAMGGCPVVCVGCDDTRPVEKADAEIRALGEPDFRGARP